MAPLLQQFTLPKTNLFGFFFNKKRQQILSDFLSDADDYWFVSEEQQDDETNKLFPLSEIDAKIALQNYVTVTKISKKPFSVKLHFEELRLADGDSLTLNIKILVKIADPVRFYSRFLEQLGYNDSIEDGDSLHSLWEMPFQNVLQVETHKVDYPSWKTRLIGPAIFTAIKTLYYAPMAAKYIDGTELELVESVEGYSPSVEKRLEDKKKDLEEQRAKIEKEQAAQEEERKAILEKEKLIITHTHNQEKLQAELEILKEKNHSKELEIEAQKAKNQAEIEANKLNIQAMQEERKAQELEIEKRRIEEEKIAKQKQENWEREKLIILAHSNSWPDISNEEKVIAFDFSQMIKDCMETNGFELNNSAVVSRSVNFKGLSGKWNTIQKGGSLNFSFTAPKSGYVTILNLGTSGKMTVLIPNCLTGSDAKFTKTEKGIRYNFPEAFIPNADQFVFEEESESGLEGIYTIITEKPLFPCPKDENNISLETIPYSKIPALIEELKRMPLESWSVGCLEFQVIP